MTRDEQIAHDVASVATRIESCVTYEGRVLFGEVVLNVIPHPLLDKMDDDWDDWDDD